MLAEDPLATMTTEEEVKRQTLKDVLDLARNLPSSIGQNNVSIKKRYMY